MLASAMPTSIQRSGKLFWKGLMPVEPCTSEEMENTGSPSWAARTAALARPVWTLSFLTGAGPVAGAAALAFLAASFCSQSARSACAQVINSPGAWAPP